MATETACIETEAFADFCQFVHIAATKSGT
jgi:hypothetical protein